MSWGEMHRGSNMKNSVQYRRTISKAQVELIGKLRAELGVDHDEDELADISIREAHAIIDELLEMKGELL